MIKKNLFFVCFILQFISNTQNILLAGNETVVFVKIRESIPVNPFLYNGGHFMGDSLVRNAIEKFHICKITKASELDDDQIGQWLRIDFSCEIKLDSFRIYFSSLCFVDKIDEIPDRSLNEEWCSDHVTENWYLDSMHCPMHLSCKITQPIKIAIVDDAFRLTHNKIKDFIWVNPKEIPGNHFDDDGNGYIDDVHGWDVADGDNDVSPPTDRLMEFYHGTFIAGIIANVLTKAYGDKASEYFKLIPIKCISDNAQKMYMKDGYKGIEYAIKVKADIINCSWAGEHISEFEKEILHIALEKHILVIASAGNVYSETEEYPAALDGIMSVAAIDAMQKKMPFSNYGEYIGLSAPGVQICSAGVMSDTQNLTCQGTSASTAMVTAACAILLSQKRQILPWQIMRILENSAMLLDSNNIRYCGKLGAGALNLEQALLLLNNDIPTSPINIIRRPKGSINYKMGSMVKSNEWIISPSGKYRGIQFKIPDMKGNPRNSIITLYQLKDEVWQVFASYELKDMPPVVDISGLPVKLKYERVNSSHSFSWSMPYSVLTIDSSKLYCTGTRNFELNEGDIEDGSMSENYSNNCDCKWQITVDPGKHIQINFLSFDSQPNVDYVYLFDGEYPIPEKLIAKFSGHDIPPPLMSHSNKVLIWFVTDSSVTGKGWKLHYIAK